ncbi:ROK family glucokinase [Lachnospiraceae bacterium ZAX-1]
MKTYAFGVDIGGTACKIGLFFTDGTLVEKWEIDTNTKNNGANILEDVADSLIAKLTEKAISVKEVQGIGIGVPGPVAEDGSVFQCVNLGWKEYPVKKILEKKTGIKVKVENDANVAALGEMWQGGAKGYKNVIMVTLGTGVGGGVIVNGQISSGTNGSGGEIGHMKVNINETDVCNCGGKGCLEQYASATGLVRLAKQKLAVEHKKTILDDGKALTAKAIFDASKSGDKVAIELVDELGSILGIALGNVSCITDPEVFVIGGGVSKAGQILTDVIQRHYYNTVFPGCKNAKFVLAGLGNDAGIYGCVKMLM